jgi:translation initiation factor 4E
MIGEQFEDSDEICGVVVSPRKANQNKLALWTRTAKDREKQKRIGTYFKTCLHQPKDLLISYQV